MARKVSLVSGTSSVTRNFVGARGIESIFTTTTSGTTTAFPLYDCHGNMVATVARSGAGFASSNVQTYDVWGGVRTGVATGGPKGRYVANLVHVQDDESGLIYMRARYYEPESGRFISEDLARSESNFYRYAANNPIGARDKSGNSWRDVESITQFALRAIALLFLIMTVCNSISSLDVENAYGKCIEAFNFSFMGLVGLPEMFQDIIMLVTGAIDTISSFMPSPISIGVYTFGAVSGGGSPIGVATSMMLNALINNPSLKDLGYLYLAHGFRCAWYIDDIERF